MGTSGTASSCLTKEQVISIGTKPSNLEYLQHIKKLAMDVSHDSYRRRYMHDIALLH